MFRPDAALRPTPATAPTPGGTPTPAASGGGGFGALFAAVQSDVNAFIEQGSPAGEMAALASFGPEAAFRRDGAQAAIAAAPGGDADAPSTGAEAFLASIAPWAEEAGEQLGVAPHLVAAHAALESGWGQRPLRGNAGADTHNVFGIKAGAGWRGEAASAATTEVEEGVAVKTTGRFRSYPDTASAFRDYAQLLRGDPRYHAALNTGGDARAFAQGLARGGYATDPAYADKLARVAAQLKPQSRE